MFSKAKVLIEKVYNKYRGIILYLIFGVCTTLVNYIVYYLFSRFIITETLCQLWFDTEAATEYQAMICNAVAWTFAVFFAFFVNKFFVFKDKSEKNILIQIAIFVAARAAAGVFEIFAPSAIMFSWRKITGRVFNDMIAKAAVSVISIVLNYLVSKFLVFRKKEEK